MCVGGGRQRRLDSIVSEERELESVRTRCTLNGTHMTKPHPLRGLFDLVLEVISIKGQCCLTSSVWGKCACVHVV